MATQTTGPTGSLRARSGVITEPITLPLQRVLRRAVLDHATTEQRRNHPPVLHVGIPGGRLRSFELEPEHVLDHALRIEIVEAMARSSLERGVVPLVWLTRRGDPAPYEIDHQWLSAVRSAGGELGVALSLVVVTRHSWRDPESGVCRTWKRIRDRRVPPDLER